jgi:hypothetical protein
MSGIFLVLWLIALAVMVLFAVSASRLIFRLRELYPSVYEKIGRPRAMSNTTSFLYRLRPFKEELALKDRTLLRACLVFLVLSWLSIMTIVAYALFWD